MSIVACNATETLMHSGRSAVVACSHLRAPMIVCCDCTGFGDSWTMTLVAHRLARIGAHLDQASPILQLRYLKRCRGQVNSVAAIEEGQSSVHAAACDGKMIGRLLLHHAGAMHSVTTLAGNGGLISEVGSSHVPRALRIYRLHKIANGTIEVHAVTAETIFH